jgi:hypothetical protein
MDTKLSTGLKSGGTHRTEKIDCGIEITVNFESAIGAFKNTITQAQASIYFATR